MMHLRQYLTFKNFSKTVLFGFLVFLCNVVSAQNLSNRGTDFWVSYGHHQYMESGTNTQNMDIYLSNDGTTMVTARIEIDSSGAFAAQRWWREYDIPPGTVISLENTNASRNSTSAGLKGPVPKANLQPGYNAALYDDVMGGELDLTNPNPNLRIFRKKGIHITSTAPIVAYAHIYGSASSGATMLLPTESWGYTYTSINSRQNYASNCYSWMYVVAKENNTKVEIRPSVQTRRAAANSVITVNLQKGQIYQIIGQTSGSSGLELTGTTIRSVIGPDGGCHKIAVFSGSSRTSGETEACGSGGGDNDMQQMFPEHAWGKRYLTANMASSSNVNQFNCNTYKIMVKDPATQVRVNGTLLNPSSLILNRYYKISSDGNSIATATNFIEADQPIAVAQYLANSAGSYGDPEMNILSPLEQATNNVNFYTNTKEGIVQNLVTIIIPTAGTALSSLRINNATVSTSSATDYIFPHPKLAGYSVVVKKLPNANAQASIRSDSNFVGTTYGLGSVESYAYNVGTYINNLNAISGVHNVLDTTTVNGQPVQHRYTCTNTPVEISALMRYQPHRLTWYLNPLVSSNILAKANATPVSPTTVVMDLTVPNNFYKGTVVVEGITYYKYALPDSFVFKTPGFHNIVIGAMHPSFVELCNFTEELTITYEVRNKPLIDFSITRASDCTLDSVVFAATGIDPNTKIQQYAWTFGSNGTSNEENPVRNFVPGNYSIKLYSISGEGCSADTVTKPLNVFAPPTSTFTIAPSNEGCNTLNAVLTSSGAYGGSSAVTKYWDLGLGGGLVVNAANPINQTYNAGDYYLKHLLKVSDLCVSDTTKDTIIVATKGRLAVTYPTNCLDATGLASFTAANTTTTGGAIASYSWNFGDAGSGAANTSTAQNPSHTYSTPGTYTVTLTFTAAPGPGACSGDTTFQINVYTKPSLAPITLTDVCASDAVVTLPTPGSTNSVAGTGVWSGTGVTGTSFDPKVAGAGTHNLTYTYTSTSGSCQESVTASIVVKPLPVASFDDADGCKAGGLVQFNNTTTPASSTYSWDFGDGSSASTATNPSHTYATENTYNVKLTATNNGCVKDTTIAVTVGIIPTFNWPAFPAGYVTPGSTTPVAINTATITNYSTGTGTYSGTGVSGNNFNPSGLPAGSYTITYTYTSPGGCTNTITNTIQLCEPPTAAFTYTGGDCAANGSVSVTNTSTPASGATIVSYEWNFGDGTPAVTNANPPAHVYANEGNYSVTLKVVGSNNGCYDDSVRTITVAKPAVINFPAITATPCANGAPITLTTPTITNGVTGNGVFSGTGVSGNTFDPAVAGPGPHTITYTFTSAGGCVRTASRTITVSPIVTASFNYATACSVTNPGDVQFTNGSTPAGGTYVWDFGEPSSGSNTSTAASPTHTYPAEGNYTVKLTYTRNGCVDDSIRTITVSKPATLNYPALPSVCLNGDVISVATATVTNGVSGTGVYSGPGVNAAGQFNPATAGTGTKTIRYTFTTAGGCVSFVTQTIDVIPSPTVSFNAPANICLGADANFTNINTSASSATYYWNFDDGAGWQAIPTNANFTKVFTEAKVYNVSMYVVVAGSVCASDTARRTIRVNATPVAGFDLPGSLCLPNARAVFTNTTTISTGANISYAWNFGDPASGSANTSTAVNGAHTYTDSANYTVTLTATSAGCSNTIQQDINTFFKKPTAVFSVVDSLCGGVRNVFDDQSIAPGSSITEWAWNFGDGSTLTLTNTGDTSKVYAGSGVYPVKLTVKTAEGCSDDTTENVTVFLQPIIDAGPPFVEPVGTQITLQPVVNSTSGVTFVWSPTQHMTNANSLNPTITVREKIQYFLTATATGSSCSAVDSMTVTPMLPFTVPNAFSPNGDGVNDLWTIPQLADYPGASVQIFNRSGQVVFQSTGGVVNWDGKYNGSDLPVGTYYYIIDPKNGWNKMSGWVTLLR